MSNQRKKLLINPGFQIRFIGWILALAVMVALVFYSAHLYFFHTYLAMGKKAGLLANHVFFTFLLDQYQAMNSIFLVTAIIAMLILIAVGLVLSHRIAGPIARLCSHMDESLEKHSPSEVHFRSGDYFPELEKAYNRHLCLLQGKMTEMGQSPSTATAEKSKSET